MLVVRAGQVQLVQHDYWRAQATEMMKRWQLVDTTRGTIKDRLGRELAVDVPCIDACVDYRAITEAPDDKWVHDQAEARLRSKIVASGKKVSAADRVVLLRQEEQGVRKDIERMWPELAKVSGKSLDEIEDIRRDIVQKVEMRKRYVWWHDYEQAVKKQSDQPEATSWYRKWMSDSGSDAPKIDDFEVEVAEESEPHVILRAIDNDERNELALHQDRYPGLVLRPSKHRVYPFGEVACHLLGHLSKVNAGDVKDDPNIDDELRRYQYNDLAGQTGIEKYCEERLRGTRGQIERVSGSDDVVASVDPVPGHDVKLTIDAELEASILQAFTKRREYRDRDGNIEEVRENQHGACVVIDVPTGGVLAMVSNPGFDPNELDQNYPQLVRDDLNLPLMNRATEAAREPGSTAKTMIGLGSITDGTMKPTDTIECTGYLIVPVHGKPVKQSVGRCWVASMYAGIIPSVAHHPIPYPHPTGFLTVTDGLERSCNVVFETIADRMGMKAEVGWFKKFGLGSRTGIGISEVPGHLPNPDNIPKAWFRMTTWFAGIGQGGVAATPIQMANVAATIARDGLKIRPRLVDDSDVSPATTQPSPLAGPENLHLSPEALAAVKEGMVRVVNSLSGTGRLWSAHDGPPEELKGITLAGKTGSAQTGLLSIPVRNGNGQLIDKDGKVVKEARQAARRVVELGEKGTETWYIGAGEQKHLVHAWYICFAPAEHPQVAIAVMVEYGETGGRVAGGIALDALEACVHQGYLSAGQSSVTTAAP